MLRGTRWRTSQACSLSRLVRAGRRLGRALPRPAPSLCGCPGAAAASTATAAPPPALSACRLMGSSHGHCGRIRRAGRSACACAALGAVSAVARRTRRTLRFSRHLTTRMLGHPAPAHVSTRRCTLARLSGISGNPGRQREEWRVNLIKASRVYGISGNPSCAPDPALTLHLTRHVTPPQQPSPLSF